MEENMNMYWILNIYLACDPHNSPAREVSFPFHRWRNWGSVLTLAAHILKLEWYKEDYDGAYSRMTCKLVKHFMILWQKPSQHCKAIFLQLKNKVKKVWIKQGNIFKNWGPERLSNLSKVALQSPGLGHFTSSVSMLRVLYFLSEINSVWLLPWKKKGQVFQTAKPIFHFFKKYIVVLLLNFIYSFIWLLQVFTVACGI